MDEARDALMEQRADPIAAGRVADDRGDDRVVVTGHVESSIVVKVDGGDGADTGLGFRPRGALDRRDRRARASHARPILEKEGGGSSEDEPGRPGPDR